MPQPVLLSRFDHPSVRRAAAALSTIQMFIHAQGHGRSFESQIISSNNAGLIPIYRLLGRHLVDSFKNAKDRSMGKNDRSVPRCCWLQGP